MKRLCPCYSPKVWGVGAVVTNDWFINYRFVFLFRDIFNFYLECFHQLNFMISPHASLKYIFHSVFNNILINLFLLPFSDKSLTMIYLRYSKHRVILSKHCMVAGKLHLLVNFCLLKSTGRFNIFMKDCL